MHLSNYFHVAVAIRKPQSCRELKLVVNKMVWCKQNTNLKEKKKLYLPHFKGSYLYGAGKKVLLFSPLTHSGAGENFVFRKENLFLKKNVLVLLKTKKFLEKNIILEKKNYF